MIRTFHRIGPELNAGISALSFQPIQHTEFGITGGIKRILSRYLMRDEYGQLHIYFDKLSNKHAGMTTSIFDLDTFLGRLPFFNLSLGKSSYSNTASDHYLILPRQHRELGPRGLDAKQKMYEYHCLSSLEKGHPTSDDKNFKRNYL